MAFASKEIEKEYQRKYREEKREVLNQMKRKHYLENKEKIRERQKEYREKNKEKIAKIKKDYIENNREKHNEYIRSLYAYKMKTHPFFKLKKCLRQRVYVLLKGGIKSKKTMELLGCSLEDFKKHIEYKFQEGMTWENHGMKGWHIDHIIPCASFDLTKEEDQKRCFHYSNLQPLWWIDNIKKSDKIS
jgi:hypothetical protein